MTSQRLQPGVVGMIVGCAVSLWFFILAEAHWHLTG